MATKRAIEKRKDEHLDLCVNEDVEPRAQSTLLECVHLVHRSLPELALEEIDLSTRLCGTILRAPIVITGMTGGTERADAINRDLVSLAEKHGLAFGVGSQRISSEGAARAASFQLRVIAKTALVLGNIGVTQAAKLGTDGVEALMDSIGADALCVHLNPAQELIQPGGDRDFRGGEAAIANLAARLGERLVVKETGAGISPRTARRLFDLGVRTIDVSGAGGTSWTRVETLRTEGEARALGELFSAWGTPTAACVAGIGGGGLAVIGSGGVRNGLDVAKVIALGARAAGMALPFLRAHQNGGIVAAETLVRSTLDALRTAMLLTGSRDIAALQASKPVITGALREWIEGLA